MPDAQGNIKGAFYSLSEERWKAIFSRCESEEQAAVRGHNWDFDICATCFVNLHPNPFV